MSHSALSPQQFHEMTRQEFESQPGLWWHGTSTGIVGHMGEPFHVGTKAAATDALAARIGRQHVPAPEQQKTISGKPGAELYGGHIVTPMTNTPHLDPSRGPGNRWEVRGGVPRGEMADWPRRSRSEPMSDVRANAVQGGLRKKGQKMRQGMYYVNAGEGTHADDVPLSAIIPDRTGFRTHEDYVIRARSRGQHVPEHVLKEYPNLGQGRLF